MTTLGVEIIKNKTNSKWVTSLSVAGDLSFTYNVRPREHVKFLPNGEVEYFGGCGIPLNKLSDVDKVIASANKIGYRKTQDIWLKKVQGLDYRFGYLKGKKAEKYARSRYAYGDYVKEVRQRMRNQR